VHTHMTCDRFELLRPRAKSRNLHNVFEAMSSTFLGLKDSRTRGKGHGIHMICRNSVSLQCTVEQVEKIFPPGTTPDAVVLMVCAFGAAL
jgi:hypothetical protein